MAIIIDNNGNIIDSIYERIVNNIIIYHNNVIKFLSRFESLYYEYHIKKEKLIKRKYYNKKIIGIINKNKCENTLFINKNTLKCYIYEDNVNIIGSFNIFDHNIYKVNNKIFINKFKTNKLYVYERDHNIDIRLLYLTSNIETIKEKVIDIFYCLYKCIPKELIKIITHYYLLK